MGTYFRSIAGDVEGEWPGDTVGRRGLAVEFKAVIRGGGGGGGAKNPGGAIASGSIVVA